MPEIPDLHRQIAALPYHHREGGRYAYVKMLSLTRDFADLIADPSDRILIEKLRDRLNESLCDRFTLVQEQFFEGAKARFLWIIASSPMVVKAENSGVHARPLL
jgi:hypothetical protein